MRVQPLFSRDGGDVSRLHCRRILVAVGLDAASEIVFQTALRLSQAFGARLQVLHVLERSAETLDDDLGLAAEIVLAWAARAGAVLAREDVLLKKSGEVVAEVVDTLDELDADLLVLGCPSTRGGSDELLHRVAVVGRPALLVGGGAGLQSGSIVAATDLRAPGAPVVNAAAELGRALRVGVTLIHNFEQDGEEAGLTSIVSRLHLLERLARELAPVRAARVTTEVRTEAIAGLAHSTQADLVAVGVRPGRGRTVSSLLARSQTRSLLVVPIASPQRPALLS
jgi:nucleotide-binding universal stress UspA family protein